MENTLNRLGILLNFIAGFLLAPQLIGLRRIQAAEEWLEEHAAELIQRGATRRSRFVGFLDKSRFELDDDEDDTRYDYDESIGPDPGGPPISFDIFRPFRKIQLLPRSPLDFLMWGIVTLVSFGTDTALWLGAVVLTHRRLSTIPAAVAAAVALLVVISLAALLAAKYRSLRFLFFFVALTLIWPASLTMMLVALPVIALYWSTRPVTVAASWLTLRLGGNDRLLGALTAVGVLCFTIGNALQFAATYFKDK
jgi:hypothetical protein